MFSFPHALSYSLLYSSLTKIFLLPLIFLRIILSRYSKNCIFFIKDNTAWISINRMRLWYNCNRIADIRIVDLPLICKESIHSIHKALAFNVPFVLHLSLLVKFHTQIFLLKLEVLDDLLAIMYFQLVNWKDIVYI